MHYLISCDWGTSAFRLRLVDLSRQKGIAEVVSNQGILDTHKLWKSLGLDETSRESFYQSFLKAKIKELEGQVSFTLQNVPLIISGMASSMLGLLELPYKTLPFRMDGSDLEYKIIRASDEFPNDIVLVSGVKSPNDIMRGEETQLIGVDHSADEERTFVLSGTHSKHIYVKGNKVTDFKTYMTGEFFNLLSTRSILSNSIKVSNDLLEGNCLISFEQGVTQSLRENLLHNAFLVRSNDLFGFFSAEENYFFLSGLLIGTELKALVNQDRPITLISNEPMSEFYEVALKRLGIVNFEKQEADQAIVKGHRKIFNLVLEGLSPH